MNRNILMLLDNAFNPDLRVQKEINTLIQLGFNIDLYCWDQEGNLSENESYEKFKIHRIKVIAEKQQGIRKIIDLVKFILIAARIINKRKNFDFIYAHDFLMLPLGVYLKLKNKKSLIYDAHEIYHLMEWEKYPSVIRSLIFFTEKILLKFVNELIVVNKKRKEFYDSYFPNKKIHIIGNWYDPYIGEKESLKREFSIPEDGILLSYFGVINFDERPINLIIESIKEKKNVYFFIAGVGKHENEIKEIAEKNKNIIYLGWQKNIRKYLADIDFIIYYLNDKRKYFEFTAPNTLYMALSHSIPLITNVPGESEELISRDNIGYFIKNVDELKNKINYNLESEEYLAKKESILKIQKKFEWSENKNVYMEIFKTLGLKENI